VETDAETDVDVQNVEAWAEVIKDMLYLVPPDQRMEVLTLAVKHEEADRTERKAHEGFAAVDFANLDTPGLRHWHAIQRLQSLVVQVFARRISDNNSPAEAAKILYAQHRHGRGSGLLEDYLPKVTA
jgi:hypothetical protein